MKYRLLLFLLISFQGFKVSAEDIVEKVEVNVTAKGNTMNLKSSIDKNISELLSIINTTYSGESKILPTSEAISDDGFESLNMIWKFTKFYCTQACIKEDLLINSMGYQVRDIPVKTEDGETYNIVIQTTEKGEVSDLYFAVAQYQYKEIMESDGILDMTRREIILNFIENFRTGYVRKDLPYLTSVFSDDALFITGKVLEKANIENKDNPFSQTVSNIRQNKTEYLKDLKETFAANKSIKVDFDSIVVIRHKRYPEFYGVRLLQHWVSSLEKNDGNLFLLIQFRENSDPIIWVRSWQDVRIEKNQLIGLHSFIIK